MTNYSHLYIEPGEMSRSIKRGLLNHLLTYYTSREVKLLVGYTKGGFAADPCDGHMLLSIALDDPTVARRFIHTMWAEAEARDQELKLQEAEDYDSYIAKNPMAMPKLGILIEDLPRLLEDSGIILHEMLMDLVNEAERLGIFIIASGDKPLDEVPLMEKCKQLFSRVWSTPWEAKLREAIEDDVMMGGCEEYFSDYLGELLTHLPKDKPTASLLLDMARMYYHPPIYKALFEYYYDYLGKNERLELITLTVRTLEVEEYRTWAPWGTRREDCDD